MKCMVCGCEAKEGTTVCGTCGFPVIMMVRGDEQEEQKLRALAIEYRTKKLEKAKVSVRVYTNSPKGSKVEIQAAEDLVLAEGRILGETESVWCAEKFARQSGNPELTIIITNIQGETGSLKVSLENPGIEDFWYIGLQPEDGLKFRILLGNREHYKQTDAFSLI